jgi:hypothetical protein
MLAENAETTLLRLFGKDALDSLQLAFMDTGYLEGLFRSHDVEFTAQTAYECRTAVGMKEHFPQKKLTTKKYQDLSSKYPQ